MEQVKCYPVDLVFTILGKENVETEIYNKGCKSPMNQIKVDGYDDTTTNEEINEFLNDYTNISIEEGVYYFEDKSSN